MTIRNRLRSVRGFTLAEVLISMTVLSLGIVMLGPLLLRSARQARTSSETINRTAALSEEVGRLGAMPFDVLAAGTTCVSVTTNPFPHTRCSTITVVSAKIKQVKVKVTPSGSSYLTADSTMFERAVSSTGTPLNAP
jgi:prepilin-type N-terminal cleavage/methylation domain-containing protein